MANYAYDDKNIEYIYVKHMDDFVNAWNNDIPKYSENIHLYLHGGINSLYFLNETASLSDNAFSIHKYDDEGNEIFLEKYSENLLDDKVINNKVYLYSCNGGTVSDDSSIAKYFAKLSNGSGITNLVNDSVDYYNFITPKLVPTLLFWLSATAAENVYAYYFVRYPLMHDNAGYWAEMFYKNKEFYEINIGDKWIL